MKTGLVLEDVSATSEWLVTSLQAAFPGIVVQTAFSVREALERLAATERSPDIALIDLGLPDGSGTTVLERLAAQSGCLAIVTTTFADDAHLFPALQAGAQGYILKDASQTDLASMLVGISQGRPPLSPQIAQRMLAHFSRTATALSAQTDTNAHLSPREKETLELIAKGYKVAEVGNALGVTYNTAAGYVKALYRKLNVSSRAEATLEATRLGLIR